MGRRKSLIPGMSFSWKRALGITGTRQSFARRTGIPTTKQGLQRKAGAALLSCLFAMFTKKHRR
jgi:hypothetical protein